MTDFTHFDEAGRAVMVDITEKSPSHRIAIAGARVHLRPETLDLIRSGGVKKGDVLSVAQLAGIMAAKRTPDLIPLCHPIALTGVSVALSLLEDMPAIAIEATCKTTGATGVEMEAMTAAAVAALTVYDMCKAVDRGMTISDLRLLHKSGGKSGTYEAAR